MYKIELCDKCKAINHKSLIPKIKKLSDDIEIKIGCIQYCGIGMNRIVILINHIPIIGDTEDEVLSKLEEFIQKNDK